MAAFDRPEQDLTYMPEKGLPFFGYACLHPSSFNEPPCDYRTKAYTLCNKHLREKHGWKLRKSAIKPVRTGPMQYLFGSSRVESKGYVFVQLDPASIFSPPMVMKEKALLLWPGTDSIVDKQSLGKQVALSRWPKPPAQTFEEDNYMPTQDSTTPSKKVAALRWSSPSQQDSVKDNEESMTTLIDQWIRRTGWQEMFHGHDRLWIRASSQLPTASEGLFPYPPDMQKLVRQKLSNKLIRPALSTLNTEQICRTIMELFPLLHQSATRTAKSTDHHTLVDLRNWGVKSEKRSNRPFQLLRNARTEKRYAQTWMRLLVFVLRLYRLGKTSQRQYWGCSLPTDICNCINSLIGVIQTRADLLLAKPSRTMDHEQIMDLEHSEARITHHLHRLSLALIAPHRRERSMQQYPIVYFAGVLAITKTSSFFCPKDYTSNLSMLIYTSRLLFLHFYLPRVPEPTGFEQNSLSMVQDEPEEESDNSESDSSSTRECSTLSENDAKELEEYMDEEGKESTSDVDWNQTDTDRSHSIQAMMDKEDDDYLERYEVFMTKHACYFSYLSQYPFSELANLFYKGSRVARQQGGVSSIYWSDQMNTLRLSTNGLTLTMPQFCAFTQKCLLNAITQLNGLLHGMPDMHDLANSSDDLVNRTRGYSVVTSLEKNGIAPMDAFIAHLQNLCKDASPNGPFYSSKGSWQRRRITYFLAQVTDAIHATYVAAYIWGGQPARSPELGSLTIRNGQDMGRHIDWVLHRVLLYQPYNKRVSITEDSKGVSRYLPAQFSLALLRFLVYVRPALSYLCKQVHIPYVSNDYLFREYMAPRSKSTIKYWGSLHLTAALRAASHPFNLDLTVNSYRQIAIAIAQNHLTGIAERFNNDLKDKTQILDRQAGHHPTTAHLNYNQNASFPLSLQPKELLSMQAISEELHTWLEQPTAWTPSETPNRVQKRPHAAYTQDTSSLSKSKTNATIGPSGLSSSETSENELSDVGTNQESSSSSSESPCPKRYRQSAVIVG